MSAGVPRPLRVLIVEDSPDDAELLVRELRRGNYEPRVRRVDSEAQLTGALAAQDWDLVLCDYTMSGFSGTRALDVVRSRGLDVPLIFVSGTLGEETAVAAMRAGAQDYVVKDNLKRLLPVIERELREAETRRARARAEAARRAVEARFSNVLAMAPDAFIAADDRRRITIFNRMAEELFGYRSDEIVGQPLDLLLPPDLLEERPTVPAGDRRQAVPRAIRARRRDGSTFPAEVSIARSDDDPTASLMVIVRDETQRHLLEEQLRQSQKMEVVGQLTGGLAHDFNNLLTVIIGNLDALLENADPARPETRLVQLALEAGLRGADLTRKLLAFARQQPLEPKPVDLDALVARTADLLRRTLGEHVEVRLELAGDLHPALADAGQVEAAVMNLALNARDAMPEGGCLTIRTANGRLGPDDVQGSPGLRPGDYVILSVSDTGQGIPPEILGRVFDPFFTTKERGKGTGLGLSMVYGFARQSGGHVAIDSMEGRGTRVRLFLPRAAQPPAAAPGGGAEAKPAQRPLVVLAVEDDPEVREVAVTLLRALGYRTLAAADGREALRLLQAGEPVDLLFTDLVMPGGLTGDRLAAEARRLRPGLPVLLTSGYADADLAGLAGHVLAKPYRKAELARKLQEALAEAGTGRAGAGQDGAGRDGAR